jgi:hypothetical protein
MRKIMMKYLFEVVVLLVFCLTSGQAQDTYKASVGILVTGHIFDAVSSIGKYEANPIIRNREGKFDIKKAVLYKSAITGGNLYLQHYMNKTRHNKYKKLYTFVNFSVGGGAWAVGIRNVW